MAENNNNETRSTRVGVIENFQQSQKPAYNRFSYQNDWRFVRNKRQTIKVRLAGGEAQNSLALTGTTAAYGGGGTSNAFTVTGLLATDFVSAVIRTSTNAVSIAKAIPTANTLTITFSADPGASTTVDYIVMRPAGGYGVFFTAFYPLVITRVSETHAVAGTDGGAVTLDVEKLTATQASGAGTSVLDSTFNLKSTADTPVFGLPSKTVASKNLFRGDRLGLVATGTLTSLEDVVVTIEYQHQI